MDLGALGGWVGFGIAVPFGLGGIGTGLAGVEQPVPEVLGGLGTLTAIATGPIAALPGAQGRAALARLKLEPYGDPRPVAWTLYGLGSFTALGVVGWAIADQGDNPQLIAGIGLIPFGLLTGSVVMFQADGAKIRAQIADELERLGVEVEGALPGPSGPTFAFAPLADAMTGRVGVTVAASW